MKLRREQGSGPEGLMTYAFSHIRNFLLLHLLLAIGIWAFGLRLRPWGWDFRLKAGIRVLGLVLAP